MKGFHIENVDSGVIGEVVITGAAAGSANAYLEYSAPLYQSFFDGSANGRAVVEPLSPSFVGCVRMSIELNHGELGVFLIRRAEDWQEYGMIATQRHDGRTSLLQFSDAIFYFAKRLEIIERVDSNIANVDGAQALVNTDLHLLTVVTTADRTLPDRVRTEPRPGTIGDHSIERNTQHR